VRDGAAAITFGSETSGGFRNIEVYNIHAFGHVPLGVLFKSTHTRGGWADNIRSTTCSWKTCRFRFKSP